MSPQPSSPLSIRRKFDSPSYTLLAFIPPSSQIAYLALRAFNLELARIPDTVSTPHVGSLRMQFWRDNITRTLSGSPPKHPVSILLSSALSSLAARSHGATTGLSRAWLHRLIDTRERHLSHRPHPSLDSLERYAENTYSTLLYLTLQSLPLASVTADHVASHVGKAAGIAAVLRGLPLLAFPAPPNHHSSNTGLGDAVATQRSRAQQGVVTLPLDIMAECGVREEDVLRQGAEAPGLKDAVFRVATRASDHLITARTMVANLRKGEGVGHRYEHEGEEGHQHADVEREGVLEQVGQDGGQQQQQQQQQRPATQLEEVERAFGVFMPAVATGLWLERLQRVDFDVFRNELRSREWKLPWRAYWAHRRRMF